MAMLRGMGWKDGEGIGKNKKFVSTYVFEQIVSIYRYSMLKNVFLSKWYISVNSLNHYNISNIYIQTIDFVFKSV